MGKATPKYESADVDPLAVLAAPPRDETPQQRAERERAEAEAKRVSDSIDEQIRVEKAARSKRRAPVKVLLLGQSESGKSTIVKNFQIAYAQNAWAEQRASWRSVVLLNLVRSVNIILDQLARELAISRTTITPAPPASLRLHASSSATSLSDSESDVRSQSSPLRFGERHKLLALRLGPLRRVQADLERRLCAPPDDDDGGPGPATPFVEMEAAGAAPGRRRRTHEFFVRSRAGWKGALGWAMTRARTRAGRRGGGNAEDEADEAMEVILGCKEDVVALWKDATVRAMLARHGMEFEDAPGFFLDDVDRIVSRSYAPSDADVVRARLRTLGVQEYPFPCTGPQAGREWVMYDVGGARSCRSAWYPYFMDVNAIIFLAPISVFDERLEEDPTMNRLEDTYLLWKAVVSSKLLQKVQLILFLNKCDILQRKLERGVSIKRYIPTYGDRENDVPTATKYFRKQFRDMMKKHSTVQRPFYSYLTTAIDTKTTTQTLATVREILMRDHLEKADLLQPL
ncbi:G-alpha-domain-containing protein [Vararia minispora EC-137]|uniref:G-alpha-domain-containing protein n=1 Tax=Vararia minispora EC-137 TaxID=1314806 RepID=A0ACB8QQ00_9AGAM|nr:G-alpha-domain-containing protein [Vararia minispora EC-137]